MTFIKDSNVVWRLSHKDSKILMLYDVYHKDSNVVWRLSKILMLYDDSNLWRLSKILMLYDVYHKDSNVVWRLSQRF